MPAKKETTEPEDKTAAVRKRSRELDQDQKTGWFLATDGRNKPVLRNVPHAPPAQLRELRLRSVKDGCIVRMVDGGLMKTGENEFRRENLLTAMHRKEKHFGVPIFVVDEAVTDVPQTRYGGSAHVRDQAWDEARVWYAKQREVQTKRVGKHVEDEKSRIQRQLAMDPEGLAPTLPSMATVDVPA